MAPINKVAYIEDQGRRCPYCGNTEIDGGPQDQMVALLESMLAEAKRRAS